MLQAIRDKAQGWIAWAIVILISIPFALWGIQEYLGVGGETEVAVVNGEPITERMLDQRTRDFRANMRQTLGEQFNPDLFDDATLKPQVLDGLVEERVLIDATRDWNLRTGDAQTRGFIASISAFQREGRFDQGAYDAAVRNRGMSRAGFEQSVRQDLMVSQLRSGIQDSAFVTEHELAGRVRLLDEKRTVSYARIPAAAYQDRIETSQALLREFYDANVDLFRTPERVKLEYLLLDAATLGEFVDVDADALRQYFEDHRAEFVAREERDMRHILVSVEPGADQAQTAAAQAKALALLERARSGEDFAALAKDNSDDPGSASNGGDLGWVERGLMVPPFEEAAFALDKGAISDLVRTDFGFHIIQVTDVRGGAGAEFEDVRDQVDAAYRKFEGENLYFDYAERLAESAYENADSLTPAAESLGLTIQKTDWITRNSRLDGPLASPKVLNLAFSDDVLVERNNSELIEAAAQLAVVVRIAEHEPAGVRPFDGNQDLIEDAYRRVKTAEAAAETGELSLQEISAGNKTLQELATSHAWRIEQVENMARDNADVPQAVVSRVFELAPPQADKPVVAGVAAGNGDFFLIEVSAVQGGSLDSFSVAERPLLAEQVAEQVGAVQLRYLTRDLRRRADVETKEIPDR